MQLILDTENHSVNINEKMSTVEQETLNEKPLPNGDIKEIIEEVNKKEETNGNSDKENVQNNENILSNNGAIESHKEDGDSSTEEKPVDECTPVNASPEPINECPPMEISTPTEEGIPIEEGTSQIDNKNTELHGLDKPELEKDVSLKEDGTEIEEESIQFTGKVMPESDNKEHFLINNKEISVSDDTRNQDLDKEKKQESKDKEKQGNEKADISAVTDDKEQTTTEEKQCTLETEGKDTIDLYETKQSDIDVPENIVATTSKEDISAVSNSPQDGEFQESATKITKQNDVISEEKEMVTPIVENLQAMEVDGHDANIIGKDVEDPSEKDITQSISDMVDNIVQNLNEDLDDLMDIEGEMMQGISDKSKNILDKDEKEMKKNETSYPDLLKSNLENMEIDEKAENAESKTTEYSCEASAYPEGKKENFASTLNTDIVSPTATASEEAESIVIEENTVEERNKSKPTNIEEQTNVTPGESNVLVSENIQISTPSVIEQKTSANESDDDAVVLSEILHDKTIPVVNEIQKEKDQVNSVETDSSEVIEIKSCNSSIHDLEKDSSISKTEDDIISVSSSNVKKVPDSASKDDASEITEKYNSNPDSAQSNAKDDTSDVEEVRSTERTENVSEKKTEYEKISEKVEEKTITPLIKLSNTMDILSDEEEDLPTVVTLTNDTHNKVTESSEKQCINLDDDDDIMLIDEDTKEDKKESSQVDAVKKDDESNSKSYSETTVVDLKDTDNKAPEILVETEKDSTTTDNEIKEDLPLKLDVEEPVEAVTEKPEKSKSLIPGDFFKTYRKNLADMTRDDLEEFCLLKIVESIIDRSNINEIRSKLKSMGQTIEEYKKKALMLTKQNRDLQVVLKSVQEEQKKSTGNQPITPLKITRSVGMQVLMTDKNRRRVMPGGSNNVTHVGNNTNQANVRNSRNLSQSPRNTPQKPVNNQPIPVPRLVPAGLNVNKTAPATPVNNIVKGPAVQNGVKNISPAQKPEKRTHSRMQSQSSSVTVDLTDDEPPSKLATKTSPAAPVRLVNPQNLLAPRQQFSQQVNSPRKVYIPINLSGPQAPTVRPGQTIMLKTVASQGPRARIPAPSLVRAQQNVAIRRVGSRHPAPLPDAMKQYQPPNWKALPPAPDLKLSKVENGIVISWKIEGYQEDSYEEIASYQLYAYQETSAPPNTALWKKIGDVKALPLPMACTLTQFMAGYKYYFAVRAVDVKSRLGPFSLPGSILLLNKM